MKILVINAGSSSLKYQLIDIETEKVMAKGNCEMIGNPSSSFLTHRYGKEEVQLNAPMNDHVEALTLVLNCLTDAKTGVIGSIREIGAVGHRVLHGAEYFTASALVTPESMAEMEKIIPLGPLHMPANIGCIKACAEVMPGVPMVAVFDTVFHATMPPKAFLYAIPYSDYEDYGIRKYGFHGTSHKFVSGEALRYLNDKNARVIVCHLGNGASLSATVAGKCVDTSMGYTPLEGLVMGTRSGDIDPAAVEAIAIAHGFDIHQTVQYLNKKSGLLGVCGENDSRKVQQLIDGGDQRAQLAQDMFIYRVKKYIGEYVAVLGGVDCVAFTGGIGENSAGIREKIVEGLSCMGIAIDGEKNTNFRRGQIFDISADNSPAKVLIIPTNEELVIARDTYEIVSAL